jgi:hypothetical protein
VANGYFEDDDHALKQGMLLGYLMKAGVRARPEMDDQHNYTDVLVIDVVDPDGTFFPIRVRTLPPEE